RARSGGRGVDVVWALGPNGLRLDDDRIRVGRLDRPRGRLRCPRSPWLGIAQARLDRTLAAARRAARIPGRDGTGNRSGGALLGNRAARSARRPQPAPLRPDDTLADAGDRRLAERGPPR